jgi:hypothetical protein
MANMRILTGKLHQLQVSLTAFENTSHAPPQPPGSSQIWRGCGDWDLWRHMHCGPC